MVVAKADKPTSVQPARFEFARLSRAARTEVLLKAASSASPADRTSLLEQVIELNMVMASQVASRYSRRGVPLEDLEQVAYLALIKAVRGYQDGPGRSFMAYAVPTIRGELRKYFRDLGWTVRPARRIQEAQAWIRGCEDELCQKLGRAPTPTEIAAHLDLDLDTVVEALSANGLFSPSSLDAGTEHGATLGGQLGEEDPGFRAAEARAALAPLLGRLSQRERQMLEMRFWQGATQSEIGAALGVTQMQVSRLLSSLMLRLRDELLDGDSQLRGQESPDT
jgi:RNA polymerase sigma-B factor